MPKDVLKHLDPAFRAKVDTLQTACAAKKATIVAYDGIRDPWIQARLWRQSRSASQVNAAVQKLRDSGATFLADVLSSVGPQNGPEVTKVLPGNSWHQWGLAVDCYWQVDGEAEWSTTRKVGGVNGYHVMVEAAKTLGLTPGGAWPNFKDWPHVQMHTADNPLKSGKTWAEIDSAMRERYGSAPALPFDATVASEALVGHINDAAVSLYKSTTGSWALWTSEQRDVVLLRARMTICADGCPNAYHKAGSPPGLDYLANAGAPGNWFGLAVDASGAPYVQSATDPAPGFYVSTTALSDPGLPERNPNRYVDANTIPYMVMPG